MNVVIIYWMAFAECGISESETWLIKKKTVLIIVYNMGLW